MKNNFSFFSIKLEEILAYPLIDLSDILSNCKGPELCVISVGLVKDVVILCNLGWGKRINIEKEWSEDGPLRDPTCDLFFHSDS